MTSTDESLSHGTVRNIRSAQRRVGSRSKWTWLISSNVNRTRLPVAIPSLTCVEDTGSQGRCRCLVQKQLFHHHPKRVPRKSQLKKTHPEKIKVAMETERDDCDVACLVPVHFFPPREPLVNEISPSKQTAVQCNVCDPREPTHIFQKRLPHNLIWYKP